MNFFLRIILLLVLFDNRAVAQNDAYIVSLNDTLKNTLKYYVLIHNPEFVNVKTICIYKNDTTLPEPILIKQIYVKAIEKRFLIEDEKVFSVFENEFYTEFSIYKDEYTKIKNLNFKYFSAEGSELKNFNLKPYRRFRN